MIRQISGLLLLFVNWFGCFALCRELAARKQIHSDWRVSWLLACVGWGVLLTAIIELASSLRILTPPTLTAAWLGAGLILWSTAGWLTLRRGPLSKLPWIAWRERVNLDWRQNWPLDARLMAIASAVLVFGLGVIAAATPTTNLDSLTYHLPRVMHWIQQQSVEHFPTGNTRQLEFAPWPAFVITNLHLLIGDDQLDNLVQWFAMLTSVIVTSFVSQQLLQH